jgi:transcriptional regulator with XRE-family HTH domain
MRAHWGRLVRERRKAMGYTMAALARKANVSENTVKNIELSKGNVHVDNLENILNALNFDLEVVDATIPDDSAHFAIMKDDNGRSGRASH